MIYRGFVLETLEGGKRAKVKAIRGRIFSSALILHPYGESSNPPITANSACWVMCPLNDESNAFIIPYNTELQPSLESSEKSIGNFQLGNKITFKQNGDIVIDGQSDFLAQSLANLDIQATTSITLNSSQVNLGDALGLVLNNLATMQVTIPTGSSSGTYPVTIVNPGQTKVKA